MNTNDFSKEVERSMDLAINLKSFLLVMNSYPGLFHLTGSRSFGVGDYESDFDYFVDGGELSDETRGILLNIGFERVSDPSYNSDPSVREILRFAGPPQIDIQVIKTVWFREKVQAQKFLEDVRTLFPSVSDRYFLSKLAMRRIWSVLIQRMEG
jgi:hypothetical protein